MNIPFSDELITAAKENKKSIQKFFLIFLFFTVLSVIIGMLFVFMGVKLIGLVSNIWINILGIALILIGGSFIYFYLKFIFVRSPKITAERVRVTEVDEPELFELIYEVANKVGAKYPRNVYVIHDANASVQFVSIAKSLFFSKSKDLNIGLLLIKYLNKNELRGILAHEFGHFTQSTMKINSWVFVSNILLERSLVNREKDKNVVNKVSDLGGFYSLLNALVIGYMNIVEKQFARQYNSINNSYLKLSKEMEYHADLHEVTVTDVQTFIYSSVKIECINIYFQLLTQLYQYTLNDDDLNVEVYKDLDLYLEKVQSNYFKYIRDKGIFIDAEKYLNSYHEHIIFENPASTHPHTLLRILNVKQYKGKVMSEENDLSYLKLRNVNEYEQFFFKILFAEKVTHQELAAAEQERKFEERYGKYVSITDLNKYEEILFSFQTEVVDFEKYIIDDAFNVLYSDIFNKDVETLFEKHRQAEINKELFQYIISPESTVKSFTFKGENIYENNFPISKIEIDKIGEDAVKELKNKLDIGLTLLSKKAIERGKEQMLNKKANQVFLFRTAFEEIEKLMDELVFVIQNYIRFDNKEEYQKSYYNIKKVYVLLREQCLPFVESNFSELFDEEMKLKLLNHFTENHEYIYYKNSFSHGFTPKVEEIGEIIVFFKNELLSRAYELSRDNINWMRELGQEKEYADSKNSIV